MCVVCALDCAHGFRRLCGGFLMLSKLVIGFALLLGSCAAETRTVWNKSASTETDYNQDRYQCERDAGVGQLPTLTNLGMMQTLMLFSHCMQAHGWTASKEPM